MLSLVSYSRTILDELSVLPQWQSVNHCKNQLFVSFTSFILTLRVLCKMNITEGDNFTLCSNELLSPQQKYNIFYSIVVCIVHTQSEDSLDKQST